MSGRRGFSLVRLLTLYLIVAANDVMNSRHQRIDIEDKCIELHLSKMKATEAEEVCKNMSGKLLELKQEAGELDLLKRILEKSNITETWLGGRKQKSWFWSNNGKFDRKSPVVNTFWGEGEPNTFGGFNEDRISLYNDKLFKWNDEIHSATRAGGWDGIGESCYKALCQCSGCSGNNFLFEFDGKTYFIPKDECINWQKASDVCHALEGQLIKIDTGDLQEKLQNELQKKPLNGYHYWTAGFWSGVIEYTWNSGEVIPSDTDLWISLPRNQPTDECLSAGFGMNHAFGLSPSRCDKMKSFICRTAMQYETTTPILTPNKTATSPEDKTLSHLTETLQTKNGHRFTRNDTDRFIERKSTEMGTKSFSKSPAGKATIGGSIAAGILLTGAGVLVLKKYLKARQAGVYPESI